MNSDEEVTLQPNDKGQVMWPYANVPVVLPPVFYSVMATPTAVRSPKQLLADSVVAPLALQTSGQPMTDTPQTESNDSLLDTVRRAVEMPQFEEHHWNRNVTVFTSSSEEDLERIYNVCASMNSPYQKYELDLTTEVSDIRKRRRAALMAIGVLSSNLTYKLTVSRTCMYEETHVKAHYVDLSGYVLSGVWLPEKWAFHNPYKNVDHRTENGLVLLSGSLRILVLTKMLTTFSEDDTLDNLLVAYDDTILDGASDVNTANLRRLSAVQLRETFESDFRETAPLDRQRAIVGGFIRIFQSLEKEKAEEAEGFNDNNFVKRCEHWSVASIVLLQNVQPAALHMTLWETNHEYAQSLPQVLKKLTAWIENEENLVEDLIRAVKTFAPTDFQNRLYYEFVTDGNEASIGVMAKYGMRF